MKTSDLVGPTTMMSEGTRNILEAMKARGICKVIACMSGMTRLCDQSTFLNKNFKSQSRCVRPQRSCCGTGRRFLLA